MARNQGDISKILSDWSAGKRESADTLLSLVYRELRQIAENYMRKERLEHTLQPTALVHEAYMRLIDISDIDWQSRAHFFAVSANVMRNILVDYARARVTDKRGGGARHVSLDDVAGLSDAAELDVLAVDEALKELSKFDDRQSKIVEMRFFGGLTIEETAHVLDISPATVKREWVLARTWLFRELKK